jgi:isoquinoline 1-oxidoreductase subunit beta
MPRSKWQRLGTNPRAFARITMNLTTRRDFLISLGSAGFALVLTSSGAISHARELGQRGGVLLNRLHINEDGGVTLIHTSTDIGQGTPSVQAQIVADQLDVDWGSMRLEQAPVRPPYASGESAYSTAASSGISHQYETLQRLGATARALLVTAAAQRWRVPVSECTTSRGRVQHRRSKRDLPYGMLVNAAAILPVPESVDIRTALHDQFVGKSMPAINARSKVNGRYRYGIDVQLPNLKVATIMQCPMQGGRLVAAALDQAPALAIRGVIAVVPLSDAVAVVADGYWSARQAISKLQPKWEHAEPPISTNEFRRRLRTALDTEGGQHVKPRSGSLDALREKVAAEFAKTNVKVSALYESHVAAHATMEPQNATAIVADGRAQLWVPTQNQSLTQEVVAKELKLPLSQVEINTTGVGGSFGRRLEPDVALQAVRIANVTKLPIKLIWSREEDIRQDFYRPGSAARLEAALSEDGVITALRFKLASSSILSSSASSHPIGPDGVDFTSIMGLRTPYAMPTPLVSWSRVESGLRSGWWRSVGASQNCFFVESFIDEIAHRLRTAPIDYRKRLLAGDARASKALDTLVEFAKLNEPTNAGRFRGVAMCFMSGSIAATAVELSVDDKRRITLHRIYAVFDCGRAINPSRVEEQVSGGIVWGLSACLLNEVTVEDGVVSQSNFHDYPVLRMSQTPPIQVRLLDSGSKPGGAGEESVPTVAPAIANAVFAATGVRLRETPFTRSGFSLSS